MFNSHTCTDIDTCDIVIEVLIKLGSPRHQFNFVAAWSIPDYDDEVQSGT